MRSDKQRRDFPARRLLVLGLLVAASGILLWRVGDLQLNHKGFLQEQGDARHLRVVSMPADRGKLIDRNGDPLAMSTPVDSVWANPTELLGAGPRLVALAGRLGLDASSLARELQERRDREFVYVRRHVEPDLAEQVRALEIPGVYLQREHRRYYTQGPIAGHVVGFTDVDDRGQEGLELAFEPVLRGEPGAKRVVRDRLGRVVEDVEQIRSPRAGRDVVLSLDRRVQYLAYRALLAGVTRHRARGGTAVVLDAFTGEVLAMTNQPAYNPNKRSERVSWRYRNRAVTDVFEPGSTVKPFTVAAALESGRFQPESLLDTTPGRLAVGRHTVRDRRDYGVIDVTTVITRSSNVGATKLSLAMDPKSLWRTLTRVGFGETTASGFPGESAGVLTHFFKWREIHRATLSYGYGLSVTALQLAQAYAVIANGGLRPRISFVRVERPDEPVRVLSERTAAAVRRMLGTVLGADGTAARARIPGYQVGGKTGTSRKSTAGGYADDRYFALFAGMAPLSRPRLVGVVVVDEPSAGGYYGGEVAAPIFKEIMQGALRLLGEPPDGPEAHVRHVALGPLHTVHRGAAAQGRGR
jgi:cell division protein FtsI (penicillin-binding protein 3)